MNIIIEFFNNYSFENKCSSRLPFNTADISEFNDSCSEQFNNNERDLNVATDLELTDYLDNKLEETRFRTDY